MTRDLDIRIPRTVKVAKGNIMKEIYGFGEKKRVAHHLAEQVGYPGAFVLEESEEEV